MHPFSQKGRGAGRDNRLFIPHLSAISLRRCLSSQFSDQEQGCKEKCFVTVHFLTAVNPLPLIDYWPHGLLPGGGLSTALIAEGRGDLVYFLLDLQRRVKLGGKGERVDVLLWKCSLQPQPLRL